MVCFITGPESGPLQGQLLVIDYALYVLRTSGACWHDRLADAFRDMGYFQCKADTDLWIKDCGTHYEYVLVYVDDLMCISTHLELFFQYLTETYNFKLKGVGEPYYHLGGDFFCDSDGTFFARGAASYVKKMVANYDVMFGEKPTKYSSPMIPKDHPELNLTQELHENGIKQYQSLIGALQWLVTLGCFDILIAVTTMSGYRFNPIAPREGHLERLKRVIGYVKRHSDGAIHFCSNILT
jgi:Reverse transcriptase (RNA-dependent DNA polymerase)